MVRNLLYFSFSLFLTIALPNPIIAAQSDQCPSPVQVENALNEHRENTQIIVPLDGFKVEVFEATPIANSYILLSLGSDIDRARRELTEGPLENLKPIYNEHLDASNPEVKSLLKHKTAMLEKNKSVCGYHGNIGTYSVVVYIGKPKQGRK